jgi:hypothetical protein
MSDTKEGKKQYEEKYPSKMEEKLIKIENYCGCII